MSCLNTEHALLQPPGAFSALGHCDVMLVARRGAARPLAAPFPFLSVGRHRQEVQGDVEEINIVVLCDCELGNCIGLLP